MGFTTTHLARIYKAKYSLTFSEGYCVASGFFKIASENDGDKFYRNVGYIDGALMMLYAQERIERETMYEVLEDALRIAKKLPSADAETELQVYISELFASLTGEAIQSALAEIDEHE